MDCVPVYVGMFLAGIGYCVWLSVPVEDDAQQEMVDASSAELRRMMFSALSGVRRVSTLLAEQTGVRAYRDAALRCTAVIAALEGAQVEEAG